MKSKSLITGVLLATSLALTGNAAMARTVHHYAALRAPAAPATAPFGGDIGQIIQSMLGSVPAQYQGAVRNAMRTRPDRGAQGAYDGSSDWTPSYDNSSPTIDNSANDEAAAIQSMNDTNAMNASMAAAEQQNEAAQAAAIQTEINANN
jgi:hypothetical protein